MMTKEELEVLLKRKPYVAWLEVRRSTALGEEHQMIISEFLADDDIDANLTASRHVETWDIPGHWTERSVVKIWEVMREVPTT